MMIAIPWKWGTILYLKTDTEQKARQFSGIMVRPSGTLYELACGGASTWHYDFEISEESNILAKT